MSVEPYARNNTKPIQPFWNRTPAFFRYALSPTPLTLCGILALVSWILSYFLVYLIVFALMTKYAFEVLIRTSEGDMTPPALSSEVLNQNFELVFKQLGLYLFMGSLFGSLIGAGLLTLATMAGIFFLLLLPAMTMVLATTGSFFSALNPALLLGMVKRTGWSYLGLYGILFIVYTAEANMLDFLIARVGPEAIVPIYMAVNLFFTVLAYHIMGYLLYQHHESLGINQRMSDEEPADATEARLEMFHSYMDKGLIDAAKAELLGEFKADPNNKQLQEKATNFLMLHGTDDDKVKLARFILPIMLQSERNFEAARLYMDLVKDHKAFAMNRAEHYLRLTRGLREIRQDKIALSLSNNLHKKFPHEPALADIYIETSDLLSQKFNRDDMALKMLAYVVKHFSDHPRREEAFQLIKTIKGTGALKGS